MEYEPRPQIRATIVGTDARGAAALKAQLAAWGLKTIRIVHQPSPRSPGLRLTLSAKMACGKTTTFNRLRDAGWKVASVAEAEFGDLRGGYLYETRAVATGAPPRRNLH